MPSSTPIQTNFTTGELSPLMRSRVDFEKYYNGCETLLNETVIPQGGAFRRPGTTYVASTKCESRRSLLVPFIFSNVQAYNLEFGHQYIRVFKDRGQVVGNTGPELVVNGTFDSNVSGWTAGIEGYTSINWDGTYKAMRLSLVSGEPSGQLVSYQDISMSAGTYEISVLLVDKNIPESAAYSLDTIVGGFSTGNVLHVDMPTSGNYASRVTLSGSATIRITVFGLATSSSNSVTFDNISIKSVSSSTVTEISTTYNESELRSLQFTQSADELFIVHPNHKQAKLTRSSHVNWALADITFADPPADWTTGNYPASISFFEQRLCFSGVPSKPRNIYCSKSGDFFVFTPGTDAGSPIIATLTDNEVNAVRWLYPRTTLLTGTSSGIGAFGSNNQYDAVTPTNIKFNNKSADRVGTLPPKRVGSSLIATDYYNKHIISISDDDGNVVTESLMLLAEHLVSNRNIIDYAFMRMPYPILWCVLSDGSMISLTFIPSQSIFAWARHTTNGSFESISVIPSSESSPDDELWCVVKRDLPAGTKRYVELFAPQFDINNNYDVSDMVFLDCSLSATFATPVTVISGLDHLEGLEVTCLADGVRITTHTVASGSITLATASSKVIIGLSYESIIKTVNFDSGSPLGTAEGKLKRIQEVSTRIYRTAEYTMGTIDKQYTRNAGTTLKTTVDRFADFPGDWTMETDITIKQNKPLPLTVLSIIPSMFTQERN